MRQLEHHSLAGVLVIIAYVGSIGCNHNDAHENKTRVSQLRFAIQQHLQNIGRDTYVHT
jgi:hypothetical protein